MIPGYDYIETVYEKFRALIDKHFPHLPVTNTGYGGSDFHANLSDNNWQYNNTAYCYKDEMRFVHWTSISNLLSMLNNREIRLYNLYNSEDPQEFNYGAEVLGLNANQINYAKEYYYSFSFCKAVKLYSKYMWNTYGEHFKRVAVEFTIENDADAWKDFMIAPIQYTLPEEFENYRKEIEAFQKQYGGTYMLDLGKLIGFHKRVDYEEECEIRIGSFFPFRNHEQYLVHGKYDFRIFNDRHSIARYFSLPLWVNNEYVYHDDRKPEHSLRTKYDEEYFKTRPKIKIQNIYIGKDCGIPNGEASRYINKLREILLYTFGYKVDIAINLFPIGCGREMEN